jgi:hypothetical protein
MNDISGTKWLAENSSPSFQFERGVGAHNLLRWFESGILQSWALIPVEVSNTVNTFFPSLRNPLTRAGEC